MSKFRGKSEDMYPCVSTLNQPWINRCEYVVARYDSIAMSTLQVLAGIASNRSHFDDVLRRILNLFQRKPDLVRQ